MANRKSTAPVPIDEQIEAERRQRAAAQAFEPGVLTPDEAERLRVQRELSAPVPIDEQIEAERQQEAVRKRATTPPPTHDTAEQKALQEQRKIAAQSEPGVLPPEKEKGKKEAKGVTIPPSKVGVEADLPPKASPFAKPGELSYRAKQILAKQAGKQFEGEKRFAKSFVPGLLTAEDWPHLTTTEKAAYIAGDVGQTILYILGGWGALRGVIARTPVTGVKGTFPKTPGVKVITKGDVKQIVKNVAKEKGATLKELKDTVPIEKPVNLPKDSIIIVNETAAGQLEVRVARPYVYRGPRAKPPSFEPGQPLRPREVPKGGGVKPAEPSTATMTPDQLARLGINPSTVSYPVVFPIPKPGEVMRPVKLPVPLKPTKPAPGKPPAFEPGVAPVTPPSPVKTPRPSRAPSPAPEPSPPPVPELATTPEPSVVPEPSPAPAPEPSPTPTPSPAPAPAPAPTPTPLPEPDKIIPKKLIPPVKPLKHGDTDENKRKQISSAEGSIAWRQGELKGKDIWHVLMYPYQSERDYVMVLGKKPSNTTIVKGPGSAYETITLRYGRTPASKVTGDIGFFDFFIEPKTAKKVGIGFKPDPKLQTTGDITITGRTARLTSRAPRITPKTPRLNR